jgi:hypothetical protein
MRPPEQLLQADRATLRRLLVEGHPVDPHALEGWAYRGTSLGLPAIVERLSWKTFQKTFYRDPATGRLRGWNVRLEQEGLDAPSRPRLRRGEPITEWHFEVVEPSLAPHPPGFGRGLLIDYARGANPPGPMRTVKDPLISLDPERCDRLLGVSYAVVAGRCVELPTYFVLEREHPIHFVPGAALRDTRTPRPRFVEAPLRLTAMERRWAELLFAALLGVGADDREAQAGLSAFWEQFEAASPPLVQAGLRPMVLLLTFLPVGLGWGRPLFALDSAARFRFVEQASASSSFAVRQALITLKTLACLAYFEGPQIRSRYAGGAA